MQTNTQLASKGCLNIKTFQVQLDSLIFIICYLYLNIR